MEFKASKNQFTSSGERRTFKSGISWMRWLMLLPGLFALLHIYEHPESWVGFCVLVIAAVLFYVLKRARRLEHDDANLYIIRDRKETFIPFTAIVSIKRSRTKVNGSRFWILLYEESKTKKRKIRYFKSFFNKEFHESVRKVNPKVVIWTHPHFNH